jgi:hypothetical protein
MKVFHFTHEKSNADLDYHEFHFSHVRLVKMETNTLVLVGNMGNWALHALLIVVKSVYLYEQ